MNKISINDVLTALLVIGVVYIVFIKKDPETDDKLLLNKFQEISKENKERITKDSIKYALRMDSLMDVNKSLYNKLTKSKKDLRDAKKYYQSIESDSSFVHINDSIQDYISTRLNSH